MPTLTALQKDILALIRNGLTNRQIADRLDITTGSVGIQIGRIVQHLGLTSRAEIVERRHPQQPWGSRGQ